MPIDTFCLKNKDDENFDNFIKQVVSYGRLVKAKYSILVNSTEYLAIDNNKSTKMLEGKIDNLSAQFIKWV